MSRAALLIASPDSNLLGTRQDVANFQKFLLSPLGGAWTSNEVTVLENPSRQELDSGLQRLRNCDYGFVTFAGHGRHVSTDCSTRIQINPRDEISSDDLKVGAPKQTLILDCCRMPEPELFADSALAKARAIKHALDSAQCRYFFDIRIDECDPGLVVLHACGFRETASESSRGGLYSRALVDSAKEWERECEVEIAKNYRVLSAVGAHDRANPVVRRGSGDRQHPEAEYPRTKKHFPFAIIA